MPKIGETVGASDSGIPMLCAGSNGNYAAPTPGASGGFSVEQSFTNTVNASLSSSTELHRAK